MMMASGFDQNKGNNNTNKEESPDFEIDFFLHSGLVMQYKGSLVGTGKSKRMNYVKATKSLVIILLSLLTPSAVGVRTCKITAKPDKPSSHIFIIKKPSMWERRKSKTMNKLLAWHFIEPVEFQSG